MRHARPEGEYSLLVDNSSRCISYLDMFEFFAGLLGRIHGVHDLGDIGLLLSLPCVVRRLEYDNIEHDEYQCDERGEDAGYLGASSEVHT